MKALRSFSHPGQNGRFSQPVAQDDLLARHNRYFEAKIADTPSLLATAHQLRYQVYCVERKFENPEEHQSGLETDEFDDRAVHGVLFHRPTGCAIGTVRMIVPQVRSVDSLPIMGLLREGGIELSDYLAIAQAVEISRFAISKDYRRRQGEEPGTLGEVMTRRESIREGNLACLSLIQFLLRQSVATGVLYWTAVMEPKLLRMLASMGIRFTSIGSLVMHHGLRQPCYCHVPTMLNEVFRAHREYWDVLTDDGTLSSLMEQRSALDNRMAGQAIINAAE